MCVIWRSIWSRKEFFWFRRNYVALTFEGFFEGNLKKFRFVSIVERRRRFRRSIVDVFPESWRSEKRDRQGRNRFRRFWGNVTVRLYRRRFWLNEDMKRTFVSEIILIDHRSDRVSRKMLGNDDGNHLVLWIRSSVKLFIVKRRPWEVLHGISTFVADAFFSFDFRSVRFFLLRIDVILIDFFLSRTRTTVEKRGKINKCLWTILQLLRTNH